ncbi:MAG: flagellar export chaperone FliS [Gammaproteobacteria bacterium]|nr:flagellar export chaperone FliS [Gammaproteobacteria bacterium]MBU1979131.1 flagellar export chaperone FliS [Gammaproteobacteria bacterium]
MNAATGINAYNSVSFESRVMGADPHKLISLLFDGALLAISDAKNGILRKEIAAKGKSISKAISIIGEGLNASLDKKVGGELALNLSALYDYMVIRLVEANLKNDIKILDEVAHLLSELKSAWDTIRPQVVGGQTQLSAPGNSPRTYASA